MTGPEFGYACEGHPELMPLRSTWPTASRNRLSAVRKSREVAYLRPDGKTQVTISYDGTGRSSSTPSSSSTQHAADISLEGLLEPDIATTSSSPSGRAGRCRPVSWTSPTTGC
jgi:S-adenosylmethionine synthetase